MCNPIKLKEYLALGKPVVSTPFNELEKYLDVVYKAGTPRAFANCIRRALEEDTPEKARQRRARVQQVSWESKAREVLNELAYVLQAER
jgi:glycosyltransferase involved in cell wall biosynthesis